MKRLKTLKRPGLYLCYGALVGLGTLFLFEGLYRWQVVDTYLPELRSFNDDALLMNADSKPTILAMGDSFTAGTFSYPRYLQELLSTHRVINAGVSGTGVFQASLMAPRRFKRFNPSLFIYQIYVGNDLINVRYPINWRTLSPIRNVYGLVVNRFRSVYFLNYRLGQRWHARKHPRGKPDTLPTIINTPFSLELYSPLQQLYVRADAWIWENQILIGEDRKEDFDVFLGHLKTLVSHCRAGTCEAFLLILPHAAQVHPRYLEQMRQLGARFNDAEAVAEAAYPFVANVSAAFADAPHIQVLNPLPMLQEQEREGRTLYFYNDGHLNLEGQAALAAYLRDHLPVE